MILHLSRARRATSWLLKVFLPELGRFLLSFLLSSARKFLRGLFESLMDALKYAFGVVVGFVLGVAAIYAFFGILWSLGISVSKLLYFVANVLLTLIRLL